MGPLCRGPVWMPITPKRGPFCTPIHRSVRILRASEENRVRLMMPPGFRSVARVT